jgi:hypothetical protein
MKRRGVWAVVAWSVLAALVLGTIFLAYQNPALVVDFANLTFCS